MKLYSAAALAAGVSVLALAQPAEGEVVITRKTIPIPLGSKLGTLYPVPIDLNKDGVTDFTFSLTSFAYHADYGAFVVFPAQGAGLVGAPGSHGFFYASALARGAKIGPSARFTSQFIVDIERSHGGTYVSGRTYPRYVYGKWGGNPKNRYLGVKFLIKGKTHYGWVRLTVFSQGRPMAATITAYAYETIPNRRILAGIPEKSVTSDPKAQNQPKTQERASLGMLALGGEGLPLWRREENLL